MGKLEQKSKEKLKKNRLQKIILETIAEAGVLGIGLIAPNVLLSMSKLGILPKPRQWEYITSSASKLAKRGQVIFRDGRYQLTHSGEKTLRMWQLSEYKLNKPRKWDGRWRMFIFDIPERKKRVRRQIGILFNQAGFYRLQDSVWVYPYDCEDIIGLLKVDLGIGKDLLYVIADEIENDKHLRQEFMLSA